MWWKPFVPICSELCLSPRSFLRSFKLLIFGCHFPAAVVLDSDEVGVQTTRARSVARNDRIRYPILIRRQLEAWTTWINKFLVGSHLIHRQLDSFQKMETTLTLAQRDFPWVSHFDSTARGTDDVNTGTDPGINIKRSRRPPSG